MSDIIFGVVADMRRQQQAWDLSNLVDAKVLSYDDGMMGATRNHIKVWTKLLQHGGKWGVVLEDDAIPCAGFHDQVAMALEYAPTDVIGLYLGTGYPKAWQRFIKKAVADETANYATSSHLLHAIATAVRMDLVSDMLRHLTSRQLDSLTWPIDEQITNWCRNRGHPVSYTLPSLVDHADGESLIAHPDGDDRKLPRKAHRFGTRLSWDNTARVEMP